MATPTGLCHEFAFTARFSALPFIEFWSRGCGDRSSKNGENDKSSGENAHSDNVRDYGNEVDENLSFIANWLSLDRVGKERVERKRVQPRVLRAPRCERFILRILLYNLFTT